MEYIAILRRLHPGCNLRNAVKEITSRYKGLSANVRACNLLLNELHDLLDYMYEINGTDRVSLWRGFAKIVWDELGVYIGNDPDLDKI